LKGLATIICILPYLSKSSKSAPEGIGIFNIFISDD